MEKAYTLGLYEKSMPSFLSWKEKLIAAKNAGYDFVEISIDETEEKLSRLDMTKEERLDIVRLMVEVGIPIRTMCLSGHRKYPLGSNDPSICKRGMEIMQKAIGLADDLGIRIIQLAGYDVYYEESSVETKKRFLSNLKLVANMAEKAGVVLGFETMETEFMNTVEKAMKYVTLVGSSYLKVYPDIGNITNAATTYKADVLEDLYMGKGNLVAMHLKETVPGKFREIPFGTGHVNFEEAVEVAWKLGVRKYVAEFWYTGNEQWEEDLVFANKMLSNILNKQN
ncbi:L-ribulose-5-phosphate 3-epimerase [Anaeromicropila herbilytica]|uniref:L-ribulose-5-phosphate 3-epimerase n=1 Tax=Anaeromicropila herbilytica TaxID=2785025 RepID=A0A7R7EHI3_9FIRM|nr:L-ribulose-5-phosphate 3-epimerase [Anaeromicropila herbilytica]BCN29335.1 L-xylulose 5-phosphate 3-epimerase [Anaeromicropila herbilytica]